MMKNEYSWFWFSLAWDWLPTPLKNEILPNSLVVNREMVNFRINTSIICYWYAVQVMSLSWTTPVFSLPASYGQKKKLSYGASPTKKYQWRQWGSRRQTKQTPRREFSCQLWWIMSALSARRIGPCSRIGRFECRVPQFWKPGWNATTNLISMKNWWPWTLSNGH